MVGNAERKLSREKNYASASEEGKEGTEGEMGQDLEGKMASLQVLAYSVATLQAQEKYLPHENSGKEEASV